VLGPVFPGGTFRGLKKADREFGELRTRRLVLRVRYFGGFYIGYQVVAGTLNLLSGINRFNS